MVLLQSGPWRFRTVILFMVALTFLLMTLILYIKLNNLSSPLFTTSFISQQHQIQPSSLSPPWTFNQINNRNILNRFQSIFDQLIIAKNNRSILFKGSPIEISMSDKNLPIPRHDYSILKREFRAMSKKIKSWPFTNLALILIQDSPNGNIRRSNLRRIVTFRIHENRRKWVKRPIFTLGTLLPLSSYENQPIWLKYHQFINEKRLPIASQGLDYVLNTLRKGKIVKVDEIERGTQVKLHATLEDGTIVVIKPMRVSRQYQTPADHFYFNDVERHNAEIAAYHLDRLLGFHKVPPTIGRRFNVTKEIMPYALEDLLSTFFYSPAGNICFRGQCKSYCDTAHAVCAINKDILETSVQLMLPISPKVSWIRMTHPYRRSYSAKHFADWETNDNYCAETIFTDETFQSRLLLDMIDTCILDFIMGNMDRHHLVKIEELGINSTTFHIDHGRSFGRHDKDEISILYPLIQCCFIRYSTLEKLTEFDIESNSKKSLSNILRQSLLNDDISPVLLDDHLLAIDRRLAILFYHINQCIRSVGNITQVVIDDGN